MKQKTILIVDDEKELCAIIKMMLEATGNYKVSTAFNGKEGISKAHMLKPDLIILDIMMPEMDGMETLKILKEGSDTMSIPVIMLTACGDDIYKLGASQLYDEDFIEKPVKTQELVDRIEKVFERRKPK